MHSKRKRQFQQVLPLGLLFLVLGLSFAWPAAAIDFGIADAFKYAFKALLYGIFVFVGWIGSVGTSLFSFAIDANYFVQLFNLPQTYALWKFVRDFVNLFFILGLLFIAFAMVFQISAYNGKKILLKLLLAALLVNFSFPISRAIIDFANIPMYYFAQSLLVENGGNSAFGAALSASKIQNILIPGGNFENREIAYLVAAIVFLFIFCITLLVLALQMVIRLAALLILVILSPIGFVAGAVPGFESYGKRWWQAFLKYAFFGPAVLFMLVLATQLMVGISQGGSYENLSGIAQNNAAGTGAGFIASMALFSIPIILLWMAMGTAGKFSVAGAKTTTDYGQKFLKGTGKLMTVTPAKYGYRKANSKLSSTRVGKYFSPTAVAAAWKQRSEEQKHEDELPVKLAAATLQDQLNSGFSRVQNTLAPRNWLPGNWDKLGKNTDHTDHRFAEQQRQKSEYVKELTAVSDRSDVVIRELRAAVDTQNVAKAQAAVDVLAKNNDLNDMIGALGDEYGTGKEVSSTNAKLVLQNIYKKAGMTDEQDIAKNLMVLSDQALASGNYAFGGMSDYDSSTHTFSIADAAQQARQVAAKFNNLEPQEQARKLHPDSLFKRDEHGFGDMNDEVAAAVIKQITKGMSDQSSRSRSDMRTAVQTAYFGVQADGGEEKFKNFKKNYEENQNFRYYVGQMLQYQGVFDKDKFKPDKMPATVAELKDFTAASARSDSDAGVVSSPSPAEIRAAEKAARDARAAAYKDTKGKPV